MLESEINIELENKFNIIKESNNQKIINYTPYYQLVQELTPDEAKYLLRKYFFTSDKDEKTAINYLFFNINNIVSIEIKKEFLSNYKKIDDIKQQPDYINKLIRLTFQNIENAKFKELVASEIKINDIIMNFHRGAKYCKIVKISNCYLYLQQINYHILKFSRFTDGSTDTNFYIDTKHITFKEPPAIQKLLMRRKKHELKLLVFKCTETDYILDNYYYCHPD